MTTATAQRLAAEAAQGRRGEEREREKRLTAERALADLQRAERMQRHLDPHNVSPSAELLAAWEAIRERMRSQVEPHVWNTWCEPVHPHRLRDGVWVLACPARCRDWIVERFGRAWGQACFPDVEYPDLTRVRFVICDQSNDNKRS